MTSDVSAFAPVVLFVYARPDHTERTLRALQANALAGQTDVYIFADAPRPGDRERARQVQEVIARPWAFRSMTLTVREANLGLADNIVSGVGTITAQHGRAIVLEDDIVTSPRFLSFMNECLVRFQHEKSVWHVNGWTYPVRHNDDGAAYFTPLMECWGWATWSDRWRHFQRRPADMLLSWSRSKRRALNADNSYDYWFDIKRNAWGVIRTWAVFWYATIFEKDGLCVSPPRSLTANIGIDGTGENSGSRDVFRTVLDDSGPIRFPDKIGIGVAETGRDFAYRKRHQPPFLRRAASRVKWQLKRLSRSLKRG